MLSLCYVVSYIPIALLHAGMQDLKRVYDWSTHFSSDFFFNKGTFRKHNDLFYVLVLILPFLSSSMGCHSSWMNQSIVLLTCIAVQGICF